jgi:dTMP kinase
VTRGCFIVLEGADASGKSTQAKVLGERLQHFGRTTFVTREPGGSDRGEKIRDLLLHDHAHLDARAELMLMLADRAQHVAEVVRPRLEAGEIVVCDRYTPSSLVYQGIARGFGVETVERMSAFATGGLEPDLVLVFDLPDEIAARRRDPEGDRMEQAGIQFHQAVRDGYRMLAPMYEWPVIDASGTIEQVADLVWVPVRDVLPEVRGAE